MRERLEKILNETKRLAEVSEDIYALRAGTMAPRNQNITGMPRGGGGSNPMESYIAQLERLLRKEATIRAKRANLWCECESALKEKAIKPEYIVLLQYRFFFGLPWKKVNMVMQAECPESNWNENKVYRIYRQILRKFS